jgi:hypothetical protein
VHDVLKGILVCPEGVEECSARAYYEASLETPTVDYAEYYHHHAYNIAAPLVINIIGEQRHNISQIKSI